MIEPPSTATPASFTSALHTCPATVQPPEPGAVATLQSPSVEPTAIVQIPPQHSLSVLHTSPVCVQKEGVLEQNPPLQ